jgi:hypothetical protein
MLVQGQTTYTDVHYHHQCLSNGQLWRFRNEEGSANDMLVFHDSMSATHKEKIQNMINSAKKPATPEPGEKKGKTRTARKKRALLRKLAKLENQAKINKVVEGIQEASTSSAQTFETSLAAAINSED